MLFLFSKFRLRTPMKVTLFSVIFLIGFTLFVPNTFIFAQETIMVNIPPDVSRDCDDTKECYIPAAVRVEIGDTVIWTNNDSKPHTITSGSPVQGVDGIFASSFLKTDDTFSHTFSEKGEYSYFSIIDPWMQGTIFVGIDVPSSYLETDSKPSPKQNKWIEQSTTDNQVYHQRLLSDSPVLVRIFNEKPEANEELLIGLEFVNPDTLELMNDVNYDLFATQDGKMVLSEKKVYHAEGRADHSTSPLDSDGAVDIQITLLGFGVPDDGSLTGSTGEVVTFTAVPEYGEIAFLVLIIGIVIVITLNSKYKFSKSNEEYHLKNKF